MTKYYPQSPTDWTTALEKIYAKQSQQLQEHQDQLRQRDQQMVAKASSENITKAFGALAQFSSTLSSAVQAGKARKDEKKAKELIEHEITRLNQIQDPDKIKESVERLVESNSLKLDFGKYKTLVNTFNIHDKDKAYLISLHGGGLLKEREYLAHQATKYLEPRFREFLSGTSEESAAANLKWEENENNPEARADQLKEFALDSYKKLGFTKKEFIADNYWSEINRKINTSKTLGNVKTSKTVLTEKSEKIDNDIDVAIGQLNNNPSAVTFVAQLHIQEGVDESRGITVEDSKENYTVRLERLASLGKLKEDELRLLREGQLPIPHAAGKTGEILLKPEQWQRIQKSINTYNAGQVSLRNENVVNQSINIQARIGKGEESIEDLTILKNDGLELIERTLGKEHEASKSLENLDVTLQKPESYAATKAEYQEFFTGSKKGQRIQNEATIKKIQNVKVRNKLLELIAEDKAVRDAIGYPTTFKVNNDSTGEKIINANNTLNEESHLTGPVQHMQIEITQKRDWFLADSLEKIPDDPQKAFMEADGRWEDWLTKEGFYVTADKEGAGRFSPETTGEYKNYKNSITARNLNLSNWDLVEAKEFTNKKNIIKWDNSIINAERTASTIYSPGKTFAQKLINTPNLLEEDDIIAPIQFGFDPSQFKVTSKTAYIGSRIPNTTRVELWKAQANILINSDNPKHKELVKIYQLEKAVKEIQDPQRTLIDFAENTGDKFLKNVIQKNPEQVSPKQWTRFLSNLPSDYKAEERYLTLKADYPELRDLTNEEIDQILENINKNKKEKELQPN